MIRIKLDVLGIRVKIRYRIDLILFYSHILIEKLIPNKSSYNWIHLKYSKKMISLSCLVQPKEELGYFL